GLAVECHNSVIRCLEGEHERIKRAKLDEESVVDHAYQDCRATMFSCLQPIIEAKENDKCTSIARSMSTSVNIYMELLSEVHGQSIKDVYPIVSSRLLIVCNHSTVALVSCAKSFDTCAKNNQHDNPELYNYVRRIKIECHRSLSKCIDDATIYETSELCAEARNLAMSRIREID
ncbi:hypothetical protein PFISCL1PPCAC_2136, partial [Pristionchus fissidentatus]